MLHAKTDSSEWSVSCLLFYSSATGRTFYIWPPSLSSFLSQQTQVTDVDTETSLTHLPAASPTPAPRTKVRALRFCSRRVHVCIFTLTDWVTRCCCSGLAFPGQTCMNFSNSLTLSKTKTSHVLSPPPSELNQQQWISVQFPVSCKDMISVGWFVVVYYYSP